MASLLTVAAVSRRVREFGTLKALGTHTVAVPFTAPVTIDAVVVAVILAIAAAVIAGAVGGWRIGQLRPADALAKVA